jgi:hypothetical protein
MFLHRFRQLFSRVFMRFTALLHSSSTDVLEIEAPPISGEYYQNVTTTIPTSGLASGRWLDDTRRMRPHLASTEGRPVRDRQIQQPGYSNRPDILPLTASFRPQDKAEGHSRSIYEPSAPVPSSQPEHAPLLPVGPGNEPGNDESRRRMMAFKYLVRLGIYNEGFGASSVPDQYQHSLGMDGLDNDLWLSDNNEDSSNH